MTSSAEELACRPESGTEKDAIYLPPETVKVQNCGVVEALPYKFMMDAALVALAFVD
jgi:hypothetical protein